MSSTSGTVGWAPEPPGRGTMGLLWNCFATMFICTWSATHSDYNPRSGFTKFTDRLGDVMMGLIAPEWTTYMALCEFEAVRRLKQKTPGWSLKQCFFLNMNGIVIRNGSPGPYDREYVHMEARQLIYIFESGTIPWPKLLEQDIDSHSEANGLIKSIALAQIIYFTAQAISRAAVKLPVTPIELFTLSTVLCATMSYIAWWHKPYGVNVPIYIHTKDPVDIAPWNRDSGSDDSSDQDFPYSKWSMVACVVLGLGTGGILAAAWSYAFPTRVEQYMWRVASIAGAPLSILVMMGVVFQWGPKARGITNIGYRCVYFGLPIVYLVLRLYLFAEIFTALRRVPVGVYRTVQWTQYIPSFG